MFWLRNNYKWFSITHSYLEDGYEKPFSCTIIQNAFKSMGSHLCTKMVLWLWFCHFPMWYSGSGVVLDCIDFWSLPSFILCKGHYFFKSTKRLNFCISNGDMYVFPCDMIIVIRFVFILILPPYNETNVSVAKNPLCPYNDLLYQRCCKYGRKTPFKPWSI